MGIKELWSVLGPYSERKPLSELRGKTVAIDLAGWVCESLNVVDYFIHPRQYLKNLFFRTSCLIVEDVTPIFVLEGKAPGLKKDVMDKRNEIQFRGVKPKAQTNAATNAKTTGTDQNNKAKRNYGRQRFNQVLKQCESVLQSMGIDCIEAPGEAEAFCAFLNKRNLVDGVISQDSDCFAYGAIRVYRNFSISTQGAQTSQSGAVDIYDMEKIQRTLNFGQHKIIAMALLCGCDYCPAGIDGIGRDGVMKVFQKYTDNEILDKLRCWRKNAETYKALELRVDDRNVCTNCGHIGSLRAHTKSGCGACRTHQSCDSSLWKEERLLIKTELAMRKKALTNADFPSEDIIKEFLNEPELTPQLDLVWKQPNIVKFIRKLAPLLQWTEKYAFQKFFPLLTRWQVRNIARIRNLSQECYLTPMKITKKRTVKGIPSIEIHWKDEQKLLNGLVPEEEMEENLWITVEPLFLVEAAYPELLDSFYSQTQNKNKNKNKNKKKKGKENKPPLSGLENLSDLVAETDKISAETKIKASKNPRKAAKLKNLPTLDKYLLNKKGNDENDFPATTMKDMDFNSIARRNIQIAQSSTPVTKSLPFELESDNESDSMDVSAVINDIIDKPRILQREISKYSGRALKYEPVATATVAMDDLNVLNTQNTNRIMKNVDMRKSLIRNFSHDDSFDILMKVSKNCLGYFESHSSKQIIK